MENYKKGKNVEEALDRNKIPIPGLPDNFLWMQVRGGSKIRNLLSHALEQLPEVKHVVWTGSGPSVGKTISCAEIMKRECNNTLYQITKLCYQTVEEYWDPLLSDLEQIVVKRKLPVIHIYVSTEKLNSEELGYQGPGVVLPYSQSSVKNNSNKNINYRNKANKNHVNRNRKHNQNSYGRDKKTNVNGSGS